MGRECIVGGKYITGMGNYIWGGEIYNGGCIMGGKYIRLEIYNGEGNIYGEGKYTRREI